MLRDIKYAGRALRGNPGFSLAALITMSVAVAAITGVFSVVDAVLLRPLPVPGSERIVAIGTAEQANPAQFHTASLEEVADWRRQARAVTAVAAWRDWGLLRYDGPRREGAYGIITTPELFEVFPLRPVLGRVFSASDDQPGSNAVALLGYDYWRLRFASDPAVVGQTIVLERDTKATYTIVGVLPPEFNQIPSFDGVKVVLPSSTDPDAATGRRHRNRQVFARLRDGASLASAQRDMDLVAARLALQYPEANAGRVIRVLSAIEFEVGPMADTLRTLFAAVALVLFIAAANVAGLQLARAVGRRREFSIRCALGSSRPALVRALVSETAILAVISGLAGLVASRWLVEAVLAYAPAIPRAAAIQFDARVFAFAVLLCVASSLLLALPAALLSTRVDVAQALKEQAAQVSGSPAVRTRTLFVGAQAALALVLLTAALSAGRTLVRQLSIAPGFDAHGLVTISVFPPMPRYPMGEQIAALYAQIIETARAVPGITAASAVSATPLSGEGAEPEEFTVAGRDMSGARPSANTFNVATGYFQTLGAALQRGRDFGAGDTPSAPPVGIVNETFLRRYLGSGDPLNTTLHVGPKDDPITIVGVVSDVLQNVKPHAAPDAELYFPYTQRPRWATMVIVRAASAAPAATAAIVRERIATIDPEIFVGAPALMTNRLERSARGPKFVTLLFGTFATVALLLNATGIAGLVLYTTAQRSREIAVRVSLGATTRDILRLVGKGAFRAVAVGTLIGLGGSVALSGILGSTLRELDPVGPAIGGAASLLFLLIAGLACYLPARRASVADPVAVMR